MASLTDSQLPPFPPNKWQHRVDAIQPLQNYPLAQSLLLLFFPPPTQIFIRQSSFSPGGFCRSDFELQMTFTIPEAVNTFLRPTMTLKRYLWTRVGNFTMVHSSRFLMASAERSNLRQISLQFDRFSALDGKLSSRVDGTGGGGGSIFRKYKSVRYH
ncbi:hypothetical protein CDAR_233361 [Caerostris darwini]|uniref:Uncharacterized protein n=1 Tax=Caerostris darwini TaxID=1538125 RepID=A0AAV4PNF5_9ARAC|nr:hypothetical protein CDAR_233361 [Caerostris darwini]